MTNSKADNFGRAIEEVMEADFKRIDAMEELPSWIHNGGTSELGYPKLGYPFQC